MMLPRVLDYRGSTMNLQIWARAIFVSAMFIFLASEVRAQIGPAPSGEPTVVAQRIIRQNFPEAVCPLVVAASRLGDGSIRAICNNRETFRIFYFHPTRDVVAMRCSAAAQLGVPGC